MAIIDNDTFQASANLSLWFKTQSGEALTLADVPEIISIRWTYFKNNWSFLKTQLSVAVPNTFDPDYFRSAIDDLTDFINKQRLNTTDINPFSSTKVYYRFYPVFDNIKLETITLANEERAIIAKKISSVSSYSKIHFLNIKKTLREYRDYLADIVGLSDESYNIIYNRAAVRAQATPLIADLNLMSVIQKQLSTVDFILANLFSIDTVIDPFALARSNANNPQIDIGQYQSGQLAKINFGEDLPSLSKRLLGNADKWISIAIANGLKDPYIDEIGQQLFFLTNGSGNQINLKARDNFGDENINKFFINQQILIRSDIFPFPSQRTIIGIKQVPLSEEIILTVNGEPTMGLYLLSDNASLRIFKLNTTNSSQYILIPSEKPLANQRTEEIPWFLTGRASDEKNTKVDIAVDVSGSLLQNSTGDIALSYGLDNAIQAIRAKMLSELGSNRRHPNFGLTNLIGTSSSRADDVKAAIVASISNQILADGRFDRVQSLDVVRNTSTNAVGYDVTLVVKLTGSNTFLPITFTVRA